MTHNRAKPMALCDQVALRAVILTTLKAHGPMTLVGLAADLQRTVKQVYREVLVLQEAHDICRHAGGRSTRYGLRTARWVDHAINPRPKKPAAPQLGPSWWVNLSREEMAETIRQRNNWTSVSLPHPEGALSR